MYTPPSLFSEDCYFHHLRRVHQMTDRCEVSGHGDATLKIEDLQVILDMCDTRTLQKESTVWCLCPEVVIMFLAQTKTANPWT